MSEKFHKEMKFHFPTLLTGIDVIDLYLTFRWLWRRCEQKDEVDQTST